VKTVIRTDRAALRKPEITQQGFYRADAHVARVGIYEYRNDDGTIRCELRSHEEVSDPESLASYDTAPVTLNHPVNPDGTPGEVNADNVRRLKVGTLAGAARMDDDHVAATVQVEDAAAIKRAKAGTQELSPGYRIDLDETPGADPRYAYPGNPTGRYDAVQRGIRVNHVALVDHARGGRTTRLRIDAADRRDGDVDLTSIAKGHQHSIDCMPSGTDWDGQPRSRNNGSTSYAVSEGAEDGHSHDWVRNADGTITIAMSDGHTHTILEDDNAARPVPSPGLVPYRGDSQFDRSPGRPEHGRMTSPVAPPDPKEQIRLLTIRADEADRTAAQRADALSTATAAAEGLRAELKTANERVAELQAKIAAGASALESAALVEQRTRADAAEREMTKLRDAQPVLVRARASLVARAQAVLGPTYRCDALSDREILVAGIRHLRPKEDVSEPVTVEYLAKRFDSLIEDRTAYGASLARASDVLIPRADTAPRQQPATTPWKDQWKNGAGQFATRKDG
jgi:hypothetical protein